MQNKAYSYIRFSSKIQAKGDSLRRQIEGAKKWAESKGVELDTSSYKDLGVSAFGNSEREGLQAFLTAIESGKVQRGDYLIVESLDRLSRNPDILEAVELFLSIIRKGVILVTLSDGFIYDQKDLDVTKLIISLTILARGSNESKVKSDRLLASWQNKRDKMHSTPMTSICPGWLKLSDDKSHYIVIEERAKLLIKIFEMSRDGIGKHSIARFLNESNTPPWSTKKRITKGWHESYIQKLLTNRAVIGCHSPTVKGNDGERVTLDEVENYYPPVVPEDLFYSVQRTRSKRSGGRKGENYVNILQGICVCADCKGKMRLINKGGKNLKKIGKLGARYYQCSNAVRGIDCDQKGKLYHSVVESSFLKFVEEVNWSELSSKGKDTLNQLRSEVDKAEFELQKVQNKLNAIEEAMVEEDDVVTLAKVARTLEQKARVIKSHLDNKSQELSTELYNLESKNAGIKGLNNLPNLISAQERAKASDLIKSCIDSIVMHVEGKPRPYYRVNLKNGDYRVVWYENDSSTVIEGTK